MLWPRLGQLTHVPISLHEKHWSAMVKLLGIPYHSVIAQTRSHSPPVSPESSGHLPFGPEPPDLIPLHLDCLESPFPIWVRPAPLSLVLISHCPCFPSHLGFLVSSIPERPVPEEWSGIFPLQMHPLALVCYHNHPRVIQWGRWLGIHTQCMSLLLFSQPSTTACDKLLGRCHISVTAC